MEQINVGFATCCVSCGASMERPAGTKGGRKHEVRYQYMSFCFLYLRSLQSYVLPNHYIFQLAERPPADMATLMAIFRPVPPLIRTHAAGLLDVIKAVHKSALSKSFTIDVAPQTATEVDNSSERPSANAFIEQQSNSSASSIIEGIWSNTKG